MHAEAGCLPGHHGFQDAPLSPLGEQTRGFARQHDNTACMSFSALMRFAQLPQGNGTDETDMTFHHGQGVRAKNENS